MPVTDAQLLTIFNNQLTAAQTFEQTASDAVTTAFQTFQDKSAFLYTPYEWQSPTPPIISFTPSYNTPLLPGRPGLLKAPELKPFKDVANPSFTRPLDFTTTPPAIDLPPTPSGDPGAFSGNTPQIYSPVFPAGPQLLALPSTALPYPLVTIPTAPALVFPAFGGVAPDDIQQITLQDYLDKLTSTYSQYSQTMPALVQANWITWFRAMLNENPLIDQLATTISGYLNTGGSGIPVPIEEAIVTRATDRVTVEGRRATMQVYTDAAKRGLTLPSGALLAGLKGARQTEAEAVSKVATDVAVKNLELEHDHMKFMLQLGVELEKMLLNFAAETARTVVEVNGQAIELTKTILTGMIEVNNTIVRIYLAKWEAYKAAVEVYKAQLQAIEEQVRVYEAEIRAELAKTEINKAAVEVLNAIVGANRAIAEVYKVQVDAESAKIESSRVAIMGFEAQVRAYAAQVETWRVRWQGYTAAVEGQVAKTKIFESQVSAYTAHVNAFRVEIDAYSALVHGQVAEIDALAKQNEANLRAWQIQLEGALHAYTAEVDAYGKEWAAIGEQLRGGAEVARIMGDFYGRMYAIEVQIDTERAREHLSEWRAVLEATLQAAHGVTETAGVATNLAGSALNGITAFAGGLSTASG